MFAFHWEIREDRVYRVDCAHPVLTDTGTSFDTLNGVVAKIHPDDRSGFRARLEAAMTDPDSPYTFDYRVTHPDGSIHWLRDWGRFQTDGEGRLISLRGLTRDVTAKKQAEQLLEESNRQLDLLARTAQRLLFSADPEEDLESIFLEISRLIDMEMFYHYRPAGEPRVMKLFMSGGVSEHHKAQFSTMRFGELLCGRVAETRERIVVEDLQHSTHPGSEVLRGEGATSYCGFPLVANGELIGTLAFISARRPHLPEGAVQMIQTICDQIAMALERARYQKDRREHELRQTFLMQFSDRLRSLGDAEAVHSVVTETTREFFRADRCYYCEVVDGHAIIRRDASRSDLPSVAGRYELSRFPIFQAVVEAASPFVVRDAATSDILDESLRELCLQLQIISFIEVPVIKHGKPAGILCIVQSAPRVWTEFEVNAAQEAAERTWAAVERARAEQALRESEERVRQAMAAANAGSWQVNLATGEFVASDRAMELHCLVPGSLIEYERALNCVHPADPRRG